MATKLGVEELRAHVSYDPETGVLCRVRSGKPIRTDNGSGYIVLTISKQKYYAHRVAVALHSGRWPEGIVDHVDGNRSNNRWANLRVGTQSQNLANSKTHAHNTSGHKGVSWFSGRGKWRAGIECARRRHHIGYFDTKEEAASAYADRARALFGEFARP